MRTLEKTIILVCIILFVSCSQKRTKIGHLEEFNLNGNVWQVLEQPFEGKGNIEGYEILEIDRYNWEFPHKLIEFNESGYLVKDCKLEYDGDIDECTNQKIEDSKIIRISNKDTLEIKINDDGTRAEYIDSIGDQSIGYRKTIYKQKGDLDIYEFNYDSISYFNELKLNSNGLVIEGYRIDEEEERHLGVEYDYNSNGDVVLFKEYSIQSDSLVRERHYKYEYDEQNNWIQAIIFENDEFLVAVKRKIYYFEDCFKEFKKEDLVGMWKRNRSERWIEFFENGKIDIGRGSSIKESGTWELNEKTKRITFRIEDGGTKYDYKFSECNLILIDPTDKSDFDTYKKVDNK